MKSFSLMVSEFDPMSSNDSGYQDGENFYKTVSLVKARRDQGCKKFKHYIRSAVLTRNFGDLDLMQMASHVQRVNKCDTDCPIIMSPNGWVADGNHRIVKALLDGKKFLWAYRLREMPEPDEINK